MAKARLFISHISTETELAQVLKKRLDQDFLGVLDIFVSSDKRSIQAGSPWLDDLNTALEEAQFVVVLCSKESIGRPWVNFEAGAGWIRGIPVIPVCHSGLTPSQLPVPLSMLQALQASESDDLRSLYDTIATRLNMRAPAVDLTPLAEEIRQVEQRYALALEAQNRIENPRILCAATDQYAQPELGFDLDVEAVERSFPGKVRVERNLNSKLLRQLLTTQHFDIVHLVQAVDPNNGELIFDPIELSAYKARASRPDKMSAAAFADFVAASSTKLVVLNTCQALFLAARVAPIANMVATHIEISGEAAAKWAECFYDLLASGYSVYRAFELTCSSVNDVPMALIRHKDFSVAPRLLSNDSVPGLV
jgi:hypothetical protein